MIEPIPHKLRKYIDNDWIIVSDGDPYVLHEAADRLEALEEENINLRAKNVGATYQDMDKEALKRIEALEAEIKEYEKSVEGYFETFGRFEANAKAQEQQIKELEEVKSILETFFKSANEEFTAKNKRISELETWKKDVSEHGLVDVYCRARDLELTSHKATLAAVEEKFKYIVTATTKEYMKELAKEALALIAELKEVE